MRLKMIYNHLVYFADNPKDNQRDINKKAALFTPLFEDVVGPPGLEPGTT